MFILFDNCKAKDIGDLKKEEPSNEMSEMVWIVGSVILFGVYVLVFALSFVCKPGRYRQGHVGYIQRNDFDTGDTVSAPSIAPNLMNQKEGGAAMSIQVDGGQQPKLVDAKFVGS